ncbi:AAA family ATPase [Nocardia fluminea]|uniref:AAA family ATPase n=1 Tax=Nocardia fluminea TaxID=134984 RepID=UPI00365F0B11
MSAYDRLLAALRDHGCTIDDKGDKGSASTPGHSAGDRGTTFQRYADGVLFHCHNDEPAEVLARIGLTQADLFDNPHTVYAYDDGRKVTRRYRDGKRGFTQSGNKTGTALFGVARLPVDLATTVYVVEGEKDVRAAESVGVVAISQAQGASTSPGAADWSPLAGRPVVVVADKDAPGRARAEKVAKHLLRIAGSVTVAEAKDGKDLADHIAAGNAVGALVVLGEVAQPPRRLKITRGSQVETRRVRWVDEDWIPAASLVLLAGREGLGKSTIAAEKCAQITRGTLVGEWFGTPRNVIYLHTEDARDFTVVPRLRAAGADLDRVLFIDVVTELSETGALVLPDDIGELERVVVAERVAFIVLDAATSAMASDLSGKDDRQVRQFLEPLAQLAARRDCVVLGLCHFGKRDGADTGKLILGSIAWSQVARSVLSVAKDEESGNLIVTNTKGNLAPRTRSMEAVIESTTVATDDGDTEVGVVRWLGETDRDARDLLAGPADDGDGIERTEAEAVIVAYLEDFGGSAPAADVLKHARSVGLNDNATKKARIKAKVRTERQGFGKGASWVWTIDSPIDSIGSHSREREPMESMAEPMPVEPDRFDPPGTHPDAPCPVCGYELGPIAAAAGIHPDCIGKPVAGPTFDLINGGAA